MTKALIIGGGIAGPVAAMALQRAGIDSSGQGASLAMEDAVTLAQCLRDLPDTRSAFVAYEQMRRPRVERIVVWAAPIPRAGSLITTSSGTHGSCSAGQREMSIWWALLRQVNGGYWLLATCHPEEAKGSLRVRPRDPSVAFAPSG